MRGKSYTSESTEGSRLISLVKDKNRFFDGGLILGKEIEAKYSTPFLSRARLGQGTFRAMVTSVYKRRCAITGENILPVLEAAHIKPFSHQGPHTINNGLLLRSDFHKLFDLGYITVNEDLHIEVSRKIHEEWFNGKAYYRLHGEQLHIIPDDPLLRPAKNFLRWHNENIFKA